MSFRVAFQEILEGEATAKSGEMGSLFLFAISRRKSSSPESCSFRIGSLLRDCDAKFSIIRCEGQMRRGFCCPSRLCKVYFAPGNLEMLTNELNELELNEVK